MNNSSNHNSLNTQKRDSQTVALAGMTSALTCQLTCHPFGVIGVRQQRAMRLKKKGQTPRFNPNSLLRTVHFIMKNEGPNTLYNGFRYSIMQSVASSVSMLVTYETCKKLLARFLDGNLVLLSMLSSMCSTAVSTTVTFPLDYWKTKALAHEGKYKSHSHQFGRSLYSAYFLTLQR